MIKILDNYSLLNFNTFGIDVNAKQFIEFDSETDLHNHLNHYKLPAKLFILGGGSNVLFVTNYPGTIFHPNIKGINIKSENDEHVFVEVGAGEIWDDFVLWTVKNNYSGIENLSLIPGNVGAVPVQNIGAYGIEVKDYIDSVKAIDLHTNNEIILQASACKFDYRNSIFKGELKDKVLITKVYFKLNKLHKFNLDYGFVKEELKKFNQVDLKSIRQAIINIRNLKLPDPKEIGNGGSFFKNPVVSKDIGAQLLSEFPDMPSYTHNDEIKLAAGWLIDKCGWKGKSHKNAAVHDKQALVLINKGNSNGSDILELSYLIKKSVFEKFDVSLENEVIVL